jgi:hypothetical protein
MNRHVLSLLLSWASVLPFVVLELVNRRGFQEDFPFALFGVMALLSAAFVLILTPVVRAGRTGRGVVANPTGLLLRVALLIPLAWLWVVLVLDQAPCFLGVPNCD